MDELLEIIAEQKGYPAELVARAAAARATAMGVGTEDVLRSWAGEGAVPVAAAAAAAPQEAPAAAPAPAAVIEEPSGPAVEVLEAAAPVGEAEEAVPAEDVTEEEPVAAGGGFPKWLAVAFIVVPSVALLYALVFPAGPDCGSAGALAVDPVTGVAVNCDGTEYGAEAGPFAVGEALYASQCAACHGAAGGGGTGPAFINGAVLATFSSCSDHIEWVTIGSNAWPSDTYGDNDTPVLGSGAAMPGFSQLTPEEVAAVSLYERVAFGGEDLAEAEAACVPEGEVAAAGE